MVRAGVEGTEEDILVISALSNEFVTLRQRPRISHIAHIRLHFTRNNNDHLSFLYLEKQDVSEATTVQHKCQVHHDRLSI